MTEISNKYHLEDEKTDYDDMLDTIGEMVASSDHIVTNRKIYKCMSNDEENMLNRDNQFIEIERPEISLSYSVAVSNDNIMFDEIILEQITFEGSSGMETTNMICYQEKVAFDIDGEMVNRLFSTSDTTNILAEKELCFLMQLTTEVEMGEDRDYLQSIHTVCQMYSSSPCVQVSRLRVIVLMMSVIIIVIGLQGLVALGVLKLINLILA